jgi:cytochrome P450
MNTIISELELPYLPMEDPEFASNPYPFLDAARNQHPWLARCAFGYAVHQYQAIQDLLWMDGPMRSSYGDLVAPMGAENTPWGEWTQRHILSAQGERHKRLRDTLVPKFTPRQANANRDLMRDVISAMLDEWAPKGSFDFEEFASLFPISVMCTMIGVPRDAIPQIKDSLEALGLSASMMREHVPVLQTAYIDMNGFVRELVAGRRAGERLRPECDLLDDLIEATDNKGLTEQELYDLLVFLFVAGYDTSKNMLTLIMNQMVDQPAMYERCAEDIEYCRKVMDETFRFYSVASIPRVTTEEVTYQGVTIPAGTSLFFTVSVSGRDPTAMEEPDVFDPDRERENRHMGFGRGMHICLGQFIARAQIQESLHLIAQRIKEPRRAGPSSWRPFFGVWGIKGLPITFKPAAKSAVLERAS